MAGVCAAVLIFKNLCNVGTLPVFNQVLFAVIKVFIEAFYKVILSCFELCLPGCLLSCPMCDACYDFLTPKQYFECVNGNNLCSKSEMSTKAMPCRIISELGNVEN